MIFPTMIKRLLACAALTFSLPSLAEITLQPRGSFLIDDFIDYETEIFDEAVAEVVAYDWFKRRAFVVNVGKKRIDIVDISNIDAPVAVGFIDTTPFGGEPRGVAVNPRFYLQEIAVSVQADPVTDPGKVVFFSTEGQLLGAVAVGALPDALTYTPNGKKLLVANEAEPNAASDINPEGSVSIIDVGAGGALVRQADVVTADFRRFNGAEDSLRARGVRIFGVTGDRPATAAEDLEPEFITVASNAKRAWVALQENNAIAEIDIAGGKVSKIFGLGSKDHALAQNALDASNRDGLINITTWPAKGLYQPDNIASYYYFGRYYLVTANEGDARDSDGFSEEARVKDLSLNPQIFPDAGALQADENLGRLRTTTFPPSGKSIDANGNEVYDEIFSFGARSFSIWTRGGERVFDSGKDFEAITAARLPNDFNSNDDENGSFDNRSDDKGPEPNSIALGRVGFHTYAFIGLERVGGIMIYDITVPRRAHFVDYVTTRDFSGVAEQGTAGDLKPESLLFVPAYKSPTLSPLLLVANEISGNTRIFEVVRKP